MKLYYENPQLLRKILNSSLNDFTEEKIKITPASAATVSASNSNLPLNKKQLTCDDLFGIYLCEISENVNKTFYRSVIILLKQYRDCMNLLGWELWEQYKDLLDEPTEFEFCDVKTGGLLPEICNEFLNDFLPLKLPSFDRHIACVVICEFCDWLYKSKFTHIRVNVCNDEDE